MVIQILPYLYLTVVLKHVSLLLVSICFKMLCVLFSINFLSKTCLWAEHWEQPLKHCWMKNLTFFTPDCASINLCSWSIKQSNYRLILKKRLALIFSPPHSLICWKPFFFLAKSFCRIIPNTLGNGSSVYFSLFHSKNNLSRYLWL